MGLNLFAVPLLALIDPVFVPGPVLLHSLPGVERRELSLRADIDVREVGISAVGPVWRAPPSPPCC